MWEYEYMVESTATPAAIYRWYENVDLRSHWDRSVESMTIDGPFAAGTTGVMVIEGQGAMPFSIMDATLNEGFTDQTNLPEMGLTLRFSHQLTPLANGQTQIRHHLLITGPNAAESAAEVGPMIAADFPETMTALARLAEEE